MNSKELKHSVADIMQRLYNRGLTSCSGGNVSLRSETGSIFITPSQIDKGNICADQIAEMDINGNLLSAEFKPSMETAMHLAIYRGRKDVKAIVHAHPPKATAWACSENKLENNLCGEARYLLGEISYAKYELMGTESLASSVSSSLAGNNAVLLQNHGALTTGESLFSAYDRMEVLENLAELQILVKQIGSVSKLSDDQLKDIDKLGS